MISIDDFKKIELKTAKIVDAQEILGADRIWKITVDLGGEKKEIVSGIKQFYTRESLLGRSIVVVNNLAPSVIRGVESHGMLLVASAKGGSAGGGKDGTTMSLLTIDKELPPGSSVG